MKCGIGGHESIPSPFTASAAVFSLCVAFGGHRSSLIPDGGPCEGEFGKGFDALVGGDVEKLFFSFAADLDAVSASLKLAPEGTNEFALGIEDEDGGVVF